ncbi:MAG: ribonuclease D, partial [Anaerolineaceae bacterium]
MDQPSALRKMVHDLARCRFVAVDTESNSLYAYQEQVCLIQFSTGDQDYLVDPLAIRDLSSLEPLFSSPHIEKIFHAAEYDIICLKRDFGFSFANIFDTMLAGRILKFDQIGLAAMLETEYGIVLDKRFQRANWAERPLSEEQKAYARLDTHYLI